MALKPDTQAGCPAPVPECHSRGDLGGAVVASRGQNLTGTAGSRSTLQRGHSRHSENRSLSQRSCPRLTCPRPHGCAAESPHWFPSALTTAGLGRPPGSPTGSLGHGLSVAGERICRPPPLRTPSLTPSCSPASLCHWSSQERLAPTPSLAHHTCSPTLHPRPPA